MDSWPLDIYSRGEKRLIDWLCIYWFYIYSSGETGHDAILNLSYV